MIEENTNNFSDLEGYIITNKSTIEKKPILTEELEDQKDLQFLYQINRQNFPISQLKKDLNSFLENGQKIINDYMPSILGLGEKIKKNITSENLFYKSKLNSFNSNLALFHNKMNFILEKNKKFNEIYDFIKKELEYDFLLDPEFDIKENDIINDIDKIILNHRFLKNFEDLINIKDKNFKINNVENKYKITSDFYEYYKSKYFLLFKLNIKMNNNKIDFQNNYFDARLKIYNENDENELIVFYIKYLLYKFMKEEMNALKKYFFKSKVVSFEYKGLTFSWKKKPGELNIKCIYFDNLEINFSITKYNRENKDNISINTINTINRNNGQIYQYFCIFCKNISSEVKYLKTITNFISNVKKSQNLTLENIIKSSIFIKNISKLGLLLLKYELNKIIIKESNALNIINSEYFNISYYFAKYQLYFDFFDKGNKINYSIVLYFDKNLNLTINVKEPYLNHIYSLDKTRRYSINKGKINLNYLFTILKSIVPLLDIHNYKDVSIKIISI